MDELQAMKIIDEAISTLGAPAKQRAMSWLVSKHGPVDVSSKLSDVQVEKPFSKADIAAPKGAKKSKISVRMLKDLVLDTQAATAAGFAAEKQPSSVIEKSTVAVYYMLREIELPHVSADHVFTFFKYVGWPLPSDPVNTLQQAGTKGWLDTKIGTDIKITPLGENLVQHKLPK